MAGDAYPLAAARTLRARDEEEATTALARSNAALSAAEHRHEDARAAIVAHDDATGRTLAKERARDARPRSVADAQLAHAWAARRKDERRVLEEAAQTAARVEGEARGAVDAARALLAAARAERGALEKHYARWRDEQRKTAETRDEAEVEDVLAGRRR